jgi:hypothetical protein
VRRALQAVGGVVIAVISSSVEAQVVFAPQQPQPRIQIPFGDLPVGVMQAQPVEDGPPVTGAPYSADAITEVIQVLSDGNRIVRRTTSRLFRDSAGRTRYEQSLAAIGPFVSGGDLKSVTINDPVAQVGYMLDPSRRAAIQTPTLRLKPGLVSGIAAPDNAAAPKTASASIGERAIEGVTATGTRATTIIPAGAIGNEQPIEIVSETWYSPELKIVLASHRKDPRFGETNYRLTNLSRVEPDPELFRVPKGYRVEVPTGPRMMRPPDGR